MSNINSPHDKYFRFSMSDINVARDFFIQHLPVHVKKLTDLSTLQLQAGSFIDEEFKSSQSDILYSVAIDNKPAYLYFLVEHQVKGEPLMPFRILRYTIRIMEQHLKQKKTQLLPLVYPIVFYNGKTRYVYSNNIFDLFGVPENLARSIVFQPFHLIDLTQTTGEVDKDISRAEAMQFIMKYARAHKLLQYLQQQPTRVRYLVNINNKDQLKAFLIYVGATGIESEKAIFKKLIYDGLHEKQGEAAMRTIAEYFEERGVERGVERGIEQGLEKGIEQGVNEGRLLEKQTTALKLARLGADIGTIAAITELAVYEIQQLLIKNTTH